VRIPDSDKSFSVNLINYATAPGCKRIIVDSGYLNCLNQPNVKLCYDDIDRIVESGVLLKTGEVLPLDVIIFCTGYSLVSRSMSVLQPA
jgi:cation diffusion facilitator CzcD-associated flavoprotein CzcO